MSRRCRILHWPDDGDLAMPARDQSDGGRVSPSKAKGTTHAPLTPRSRIAAYVGIASLIVVLGLNIRRSRSSSRLYGERILGPR